MRVFRWQTRFVGTRGYFSQPFIFDLFEEWDRKSSLSLLPSFYCLRSSFSLLSTHSLTCSSLFYSLSLLSSYHSQPSFVRLLEEWDRKSLFENSLEKFAQLVAHTAGTIDNYRCYINISVLVITVIVTVFLNCTGDIFCFNYNQFSLYC